MSLNVVDLFFILCVVIGILVQLVVIVVNLCMIYGGGIFFNGVSVIVNVLVFWFVVMSFSFGFNCVVMEDVLFMLDYCGYVNELWNVIIKDLEFCYEINDFFCDCFIEVCFKYLIEWLDSVVIDVLLNCYGDIDIDWIGLYVFQDIVGYYDSFWLDLIREGFFWLVLWDVEWDVSNFFVYGKFYCNEWWFCIQQVVLNDLGDIDLQFVVAEFGWGVV